MRNAPVMLLCSLYASSKILKMQITFEQILNTFIPIENNYLDETVQSIYLTENETCDLIAFYNTKFLNEFKQYKSKWT